ncbi:L-lysine 6-transaminase [Nitriliruptor alkaliphilus]|uniref:L-lysine 6-transaminase n=1 Tax=Nitriliruptor alkaliphilus TaxID=427918 RepID=UPI001B8000A6|nr:L-lysine 6-transaminase [Nitriliruptor alkaliphilus]
MTDAVVDPGEVVAGLRPHLLVDGYDLVLDLDRSQGRRLVDARDGTSYLDAFTFFASNALGMNHQALTAPEVQAALGRAATHKPSNSDVYTPELARFVATFERVLGVPQLPYLFLIEGGALAVENALKAAFDWKSRHNEQAGRDPALGTRVLHLTGAFHGRSGYTLSLTNTDPVKTARFPTFDWPRIPTPALRFPAEPEATRAAEDAALAAARDAFAATPHDVACTIVEPIQGEGGDNHLSERFLTELQALTHDHDALLVCDEVQTGVGMTGTPWAFQQLGLTPDLVAFGKKTHVCGVMGGGRLDEIETHVWKVSSRINSTFGGGLVDLVRATVVLETIERDGLIPAAGRLGHHLLGRLEGLAAQHAAVTQPRGRGLFAAVDLPDAATRDAVIAHLFAVERVMLLPCGDAAVRFRPPLTVTTDELDEAVDALERAVVAVTTR